MAGHALSRPDAPAFLCEDGVTTWSGYDRNGRERAEVLLAAGVRPRQRVAVMLPDGPEVHEWFLGIERAAAVIVGIGPRAGAAEVRHLLERSRAAYLVDAGGLHPVEGASADDSIDIPPELWLLNSTSGTTGLPKCVMHTQSRWFFFHRLAVEAGALGEQDVFMSVLPAPFGFGIWTAHFTPALLGVPVVVMPRFSAAGALDLIARHRVSVLACVSTQFVMMLNAAESDGRDLSSLRVMFTGGEAVPNERASEFEERTGARVLQFYGSNETGALSRTSLTDSRDRRLRTAGRTIDEMKVRLLDGDDDVTASGGPGEPVCRGPALSMGYWDDDDANRRLYTPDGWMRTGDLATIDPDGYLSVVGRLSDIIIRGGKNISAPQVESEVATHPRVAMAAAVAMPDPVFGERVCVYVTLRDPVPLSLAELTEHLLSRGCGKELLPERVVVLDELPTASGGKVAKAELREDIRRRLVEESPAGA